MHEEGEKPRGKKVGGGVLIKVCDKSRVISTEEILRGNQGVPPTPRARLEGVEDPKEGRVGTG